MGKEGRKEGRGGGSFCVFYLLTRAKTFRSPSVGIAGNGKVFCKSAGGGGHTSNFLGPAQTSLPLPPTGTIEAQEPV